MSMKTATFIRTGKQLEENLGRQASLVFAAVEGHPEGATLEQITNEINANGLVTRQEPMRIAMYYLAIFKKRGFIVMQDGPGQPVVPSTLESSADAEAEAALEANVPDSFEDAEDDSELAEARANADLIKS